MNQCPRLCTRWYWSVCSVVKSTEKPPCYSHGRQQVTIYSLDCLKKIKNCIDKEKKKRQVQNKEGTRNRLI
uniref:Uncharacterized protein n=1 Tax=Rhizophora mucronata TaxID=61149 RepID=A0A2P2N8K6_RHIMU